ncbi:MAG: DUF1810 domain-containing protein [Parafilimonas sp.]
MPDNYSLEKFIEAQRTDYAIALSEIKNGRKQSHYMWYIFPQIQGLGFTSTSKYYAIKNINEATAYLQHEVLSNNLIEICNALLALETNDAHKIFGSPDDMKLRSSMTLFAEVKDASAVFQKVLDKFFKGRKDEKTLQLLKD